MEWDSRSSPVKLRCERLPAPIWCHQCTHADVRLPPLLFSQETLDSARTHIPTFSFATKQALMEILQLLPKLNSDALVLLSNEIVHRFRFILASEYEK
nr:unnamed protein product [Spirometra erinaceieuropaei]